MPARDTEPLERAPGRVPWAELLRRVFATDVLSCPCGGRRSVVAIVVDSAMARAVLAALGLTCTPATSRWQGGPPPGRALVRRRFVTRPTANTFGQGSVCAEVAPTYAR